MEVKYNTNSKTQSNMDFKEWGKVALYTGGMLALYVGASYAATTFEEQVNKASAFTLGKFAAMILGGGAVIGGGMQVKDGNVMKGLGIVAVTAMIGVAVALIKDETMLKVLN